VLALPLLLLMPAELQRMEWTVGDDTREALVWAQESKEKTPAPLVFAFHGHGGTMKRASESFRIHEEWPEAVVVYMQGLNTPGKTDPEGRKPGWQKAAGDQGDRDLKFFDAALATMKETYAIDEKRVYATGHSNGGAFTYLLWASRGDRLAAVAPSAAAGCRDFQKSNPKPLPLFHVAGRKDDVVPFDSQSKALESLRTFNGCEGEGKEWEKTCTIYESPKGAPVVTFVHDGDHKYPAEAPSLIVKFFKKHKRP
jgi:polyhydroxybutyrate depolymerase